jgi:hypothetical protein
MTSINDTVPEWTVQRIQGYIDGQIQESVSLDYKDSRSLGHGDTQKKELAKDVSAMANSEGGILIYGVQEKGNFPTQIDDGVDPAKINREFIENVLTSSIHPRINGLLIHPLPLPSGNTLFVIEIPKTLEGGPHQSGDKKYYKRFNFKAEAMEDYEVRDIMRRSLGPDLSCGLSVSDYIGDQESENFGQFALILTISNNSHAVALYAHFLILVDSKIEILDGGGFQVENEERDYTFEGVTFQVNRLDQAWAVPPRSPLWRGLHRRLKDSPIKLKLRERGDFGYMIFANLLAPQMEEKTFAFALHLDSSQELKLVRDTGNAA